MKNVGGLAFKAWTCIALGASLLFSAGCGMGLGFQTPFASGGGDGFSASASTVEISTVSGSSSLGTLSTVPANSGVPVKVVLTTKTSTGKIYISTTSLTVTFSANITGTFGSVTSNGDGTYETTFTPSTTGTLEITGVVGGQSLTNKTPAVTVKPATNSASSSISGTTSITANGFSTSTITITLIDSGGDPVRGVVPTFGASGTSNNYAACTATDASGVSTCTMTSTKAESKSLSITWPISKTENTVTFVHGTAATVAFTTQPVGAVLQTVDFSVQPVVTIRDLYANTVSTGVDATADITMSLNSGTGTLGGTTTVTAVAGVATFTDLSASAFGTKVLLATKSDTSGSGGTASLTSTSDNVVINPPAPGAFTLTATAGASSVALSWTSSSNASSYKIYSGTVSGSLSLLTTVTGTTHSATTLTPGTQYYFKVAASNATGDTDSSEETATPMAAFTVSSVAVNGADTLRVTFGASTGSTNFKLQYGTSTGSYSTTVATVTSPYDIGSLTAGTTYYILVTAENATGSAAAAEALGVPIEAFTATSATAAANKVTLVWPTVAGATSYDIRYGTSTGTYTSTATGVTSPYDVTGLTNGTAYYFKVRANNGSGSQLSTNELSATPVSNPQLSSISPNYGITTNTTAITLNGTGFDTGATVTVDGVACASPTVVSATQITCTAAAHASGVVDVVVTNPDGITSTYASSFSYKTIAKLITVMSPVIVDSTLVNSTRDFMLTVTNTGEITASSIAVSSAPTAPFNWTGGTFPGTDGSCSNTLPGGASCKLQMRFSPTSVGTGQYSGSLSLSYNNGSSTQTLSASYGGPVHSTSTDAVELVSTQGSAQCVRFGNGTIKCWGIDAFGELGLGKNSHAGDDSGEMGDSLGTVDLGTGRTATVAVKGSSAKSACAILDNGTVKCWGYNRYGQLGQGDLTNRGSRSNQLGDNLAAIDLGTGVTASQVSLGSGFACALTTTGAVRCWGRNNYGQLGIGAATGTIGGAANEMGDNLTSVSLGTGRTATEIATSDTSVCALLDNSSVKCWGRNNFGQLGIGSTVNKGSAGADMGDSLAAVDLGTGRTAKHIAAGATHFCAILDNDSVKCWGRNQSGQLGQGDTDNRGDDAGEMGDSLPAVSLGTGRTADSLALMEAGSCAWLDNDTVKCWGENTSGELGLGDTNHRGDGAAEMGDSLASVNLGTGRTPLKLSAGAHHVCAVLDNSTVKCWGANPYGQLGSGSTEDLGGSAGTMGDSLATVSLGTGRTAKDIAAVGEHTCAILDNDSMKCWGNRQFGALGDGVDAYLGDESGEMGSSLPTVSLGSGRTVTSMAAGRNHICALLDDATVKCWGRNNYGQLGLGDTNARGDSASEMGDSLSTVSLGTAKSGAALAAGYDSTCAILNDGTLKCWGNNDYGQLGKEDTTVRGDGAGEMGNSNSPLTFGSGRTVIQVAGGAHHYCAILDNNSLKCWGQGTYGQLGRGDTNDIGDGAGEMGATMTAVDLGTGRHAIQVSAGAGFTCAVLDDASVKCWGKNDVGQLGIGSTANRGDGAGEMGDSLAAVDLGTGRTALKVAAGPEHACALLDNLTVKCWGKNASGQLGQGDMDNRGDGAGELGDTLASVDVGTSLYVLNVATMNANTCALLTDRTVKCWGEGRSGVNGQGTNDAVGDEAGEMGSSLLYTPIQ